MLSSLCFCYSDSFVSVPFRSRPFRSRSRPFPFRSRSRPFPFHFRLPKAFNTNNTTETKRNGTEQEWNGNGTEIERKWNVNGTKMERKWNGRERERNG